jgi:hypothetical protein
VEDQTVEALVSRAHLDQWWETVVMAVGHATPQHRARLLAGVLDRADAEPRHGRRLRLLAAACLDTAQMVEPEVTQRVEAALAALLPPRGQKETRSLALAGGRMLRLLPSSLDGLSDASATASVKTAALIGGPEAQRLLSRWAPDPRGAVQRALAQVWRYFHPADYAEAVLRDAPLEYGEIWVESVEHVAHLRRLRNLRAAQLALHNIGPADGLAFLHDAPPLITMLSMTAEGPVDLAPLANCPALGVLSVHGGVCTGVEVLPRLTTLHWLTLVPADRGRDLSFLGDCPALTVVYLPDCTELADLSALGSASGLEYVHLGDATRLCDLRALVGLANLRGLGIASAPLSGGLDAVTPLLGRFARLLMWSVPTVTSLDALAGGALESFDLGSCPVIDLAPLGTLPSLKQVCLRRLASVSLAPLATLPHLRKLELTDMDEPVDLSPLAQTTHRVQLRLRNTATTGNPGPLVKIRKF